MVVCYTRTLASIYIYSTNNTCNLYTVVAYVVTRVASNNASPGVVQTTST